MKNASSLDEGQLTSDELMSSLEGSSSRRLSSLIAPESRLISSRLVSSLRGNATQPNVHTDALVTAMSRSEDSFASEGARTPSTPLAQETEAGVGRSDGWKGQKGGRGGGRATLRLAHSFSEDDSHHENGGRADRGVVKGFNETNRWGYGSDLTDRGYDETPGQRREQISQDIRNLHVEEHGMQPAPTILGLGGMGSGRNDARTRPGRA